MLCQLLLADGLASWRRRRRKGSLCFLQGCLLLLLRVCDRKRLAEQSSEDDTLAAHNVSQLRLSSVVSYVPLLYSLCPRSHSLPHTITLCPYCCCCCCCCSPSPESVSSKSVLPMKSSYHLPCRIQSTDDGPVLPQDSPVSVDGDAPHAVVDNWGDDARVVGSSSRKGEVVKVFLSPLVDALKAAGREQQGEEGGREREEEEEEEEEVSVFCPTCKVSPTSELCNPSIPPPISIPWLHPRHTSSWFAAASPGSLCLPRNSKLHIR